MERTDQSDFFDISLVSLARVLFVVLIILAFIFGTATLGYFAFALASVETEEQDDTNTELARWYRRLFWIIIMALVFLLHFVYVDWTDSLTRILHEGSGIYGKSGKIIGVIVRTSIAVAMV